MSVTSSSGMDDEVDYTSYEYQHIYYNHPEDGGNSANSEATVELEILAGTGGLDQNEVAELVAVMNPQVQTAADGQEGLIGSNQQPGNMDFRGVFGVNLDSKQDQLLQGADQDTTGRVIQANDGGNPGRIRGISKTESAILYHWDVTPESGFSDTANGTGGASATLPMTTGHIPYRQMLGRGPILDSADDLGFVSTVNKNNVGFDAENTVRMTLVWDVATVDDAGRKFGIPASMR